VGSTLNAYDSCRFVFQCDRILEENNKYLLDGEIAGETLQFENQDSGFSNTYKKIWLNNLLVVKEIYSSKNLSNI
jgi:hypothetical protein